MRGADIVEHMDAGSMCARGEAGEGPGYGVLQMKFAASSVLPVPL